MAYLSSYPMLNMWGSAQGRLADYGMVLVLIAILVPAGSYFSIKRKRRLG